MRQVTVQDGRVVDIGAEFSRPDGKNLPGLIAFIERAPDCTLRAGEGAMLVAALKQYGYHTQQCERPRGPECTCGWEELKRLLKIS